MIRGRNIKDLGIHPQNCPFCKDSDLYIDDGSDYCGQGFNVYYIEIACLKCGLTIKSDMTEPTKENFIKLIENWNKISIKE